MSSSEPVGFAVIGGGWVADVHARAIRANNNARLIAVGDYARDRGRAGRGRDLAAKYGVESYSDDYRRLFDDPRVEAVTVALPNGLHFEVAYTALQAGRHVVIEKPLVYRLDEADRLIALAAEKKLTVGYAEELCYCPKFLRGKQLIEDGVIGDLFFVRQIEQHAGPYSEWFYDPLLAGGGALMDMGCHSIEYLRWIFDKRPVRKVTAQMANYMHKDRGALEDHVVLHLEFEGGKAGLVEAGWALHGGMESIARHQGTRGVLDVDLLGGNGIDLFSLEGVAVENLLPGWTRPDFEWLWQNGYPQEMADFAAAIREGRAPIESAADGRAVLELIWAAYESAATGRAIELPFRPDPRWRTPVDPWLER